MSATVIDKDETLLQILIPMNWPAGALTATQEKNGEIFYWKLSSGPIIEAKINADEESSILSQVGINNKVDSVCCEVVARDWSVATVTVQDVQKMLSRH